MKKFIRPNVLRAMFREDIELFGQPEGDLMEWVSRIIDECPAAENVVHLPLAFGQSVWTLPEMEHGVVESMYVGKFGIQRVFVRLDNGQKINFALKGIGKDVTAKPPVQGVKTPSAPRDPET